MPERSLRPVLITGVGLICGAGPGPVEDFRAAAYIADRKQLKLMSRAVQLGVAAVRLALSDRQRRRGDDPSDLSTIPPHRRGLYVGASPQVGEAEDLRPALEASTGPDGRFDLHRFATEGVRLIHPLWLVKGLSNNVLGFASAIHDLQGTNLNLCDGEEGGWSALVEGARAVALGRADLVVAGASESLVGAALLLGGQPAGEGAAFFVLEPAAPGVSGTPWSPALRAPLSPPPLGLLGAATWPVALARSVSGNTL
ncbi:hypothetical protein L6R53_32545 [Myxococcota bacterium]|nr:hypothetical protein [Myxococcota bacterium]